MTYSFKHIITKLNAILLIAAVTILCSCGNKPKPANDEQANVTANDKALTFDGVLKCHSYTYNDGYFMTADYGCIYNPNGGNNWGNVVVYLVPQKASDITDDQIAAENKKINALNAAQYKKDYTIYVFLVDKKYLNYNKDGDPAYYQKDKFTETLYTYDSGSDKWNIIDTINVNGDATKEQTWRYSFLNKRVNKPKPAVVSGSDSISGEWLGTYNININEDHSDWRDMQKISLIVTKDSVIYHAEGYQIDQTYLLSGTENGASLQLKYKSALDNTESAVLDKTKDFGTITKNGKDYKWTCPYLNISFTEGKSAVYTLNKK
ncbi:hypothetical protein [Mucilaginibacter paludis]|uniref:Lipoprotein n=1 Tax=Mucilaginibacter paludis DSM 18603 TaxID=714943 RepID=H1Y9Z2_9SPHI|nr:hypothetical protein [Mucilaginibacter paludis]EHQ24976.1 hypothetical protein Mucpa_0795 [Mucilaginibacter paludis DSM 18603]